MITQTSTSKDIIDRRDRAIASALLGFIGFILGALGVHVIKPAQDRDADLVQIVSTALDRGQEFWSRHVPGWHNAKVVLFTARISTPCGDANKMTGPFYCPADEHIYLDLTFLRSINGDLGRAYVIAHELGHHVQHFTRHDAGESVAVELEADCYAGEWMRDEWLHGFLVNGEISSAYNEAAAVGDKGPRETWTHGDADHRIASVTKGYSTGACQ